MIEINLVFPIGFRCNATQFLINYKLRTMALPLDWNRVDFETACYNILHNFDILLNDIVIYKKNKYKKLLYPLNTNSVVKNLDNFFKLKHIFGWNQRDYSNVTFRLNQNFLPSIIDKNIYNWNRICFFWHHDINQPEIIELFNKRIQRYHKIKQHNNVLYFHISKILTNYKKQIIYYKQIILKYKLQNHFFCIVLCLEDISKHSSLYIDNILFVLLKVPTEKKQQELNNYIVTHNIYTANDLYNNIDDFIHPSFFRIEQQFIYKCIQEHYICKLVQKK